MPDVLNSCPSLYHDNDVTAGSASTPHVRVAGEGSEAVWVGWTVRMGLSGVVGGGWWLGDRGGGGGVEELVHFRNVVFFLCAC